MRTPEPRGRSFAQLRRSAVADQAQRVVELADAGKACGKSDIAERQICCLDQYPRGLRALRAGQGKRAGTGLGLQQPLKLSCGVAESGGKPGDTFAVDDAVGDQPHGPGDEVAADVPLGRTRRRVRAAAFTRPEAGTLGGRRSRIKPDIAGERWPDRTAGAAIYPGGQHRGDEPAVEPSVLGLHGPIAAVEVFMHGSTITPDH